MCYVGIVCYVGTILWGMIVCVMWALCVCRHYMRGVTVLQNPGMNHTGIAMQGKRSWWERTTFFVKTQARRKCEWVSDMIDTMQWVTLYLVKQVSLTPSPHPQDCVFVCYYPLPNTWLSWACTYIVGRGRGGGTQQGGGMYLGWGRGTWSSGWRPSITAILGPGGYSVFW